MSNNTSSFSESAKGFTKSPLGIIALFIVLVYGFATLAVALGGSLESSVTPLIYFLVFFPVLVFLGFLWLVSKHNDKIYGPSDFVDETNFLKMRLNTVASLVKATDRDTADTDNYNSQADLDSIVDLVSKTTNKMGISLSGNPRNRILWVDDNPGNNVHARHAFETIGIEVRLALSTDEALNKLRHEPFSAIISDMGRKEGPQEGYVLLDALRKTNNNIPYFIYAGSNRPEHKLMAQERGAQGSTNRADELFRMVTSVIPG